MPTLLALEHLHLAYDTARGLRTDVVMLGILLLGLIGYLFDGLLVLLQKRFAPWSGKDT